MFSELVCPLDGTGLVLSDKSWRCTQGHCFDMASQGYVNLLPVQNKRTRDPGDSKEMVAARRRFLEQGYYAPIAKQLAAMLKTAGSDVPAVCLDAGCGEGYYLRQCRSLSAPDIWSWVGLDISKWAVMAAAKADRQSRWIVGSNASLPLASGSVDQIVCMFGFPVYEEFRRVLKPGGHVLMVDAGEHHLAQLRRLIYPELKSKKPEAATPQGFTEQARETLRFDILLPNQSVIGDLLCMTPHLYRASAQGREQAQALDSIALTADIQFRQYQLQ